MTSALAVADVARSVSFFSYISKYIYQQQFTDLFGYLPQVGGGMENITMVKVG